MKRVKATALIRQVLERAAAAEWPASTVSEIHVFGSYMRGALYPGDVDLAFRMDTSDDEQWKDFYLDCLFSSRDPFASVRKSLRGGSRSVSLTKMDGDEYSDIPMLLIWSKGEDVATAMARVDWIQADPVAARAPRHDMVDAFDGIEDHVSRATRGYLKDLAEAQVITVEQITLDEAALQRDDYWAYARLRHWGEQSPLRRHAESALVHLTKRDGNLDRVILQGRSFEMKRPESRAIYLGLKFHDFSRFADLVEHFDVVEWIELVRPTTKKGPIIALRINIIDMERLRKFFDIMRAEEGKRMREIMSGVWASLDIEDAPLIAGSAQDGSPSSPA